jgi:hypothetical protein
LSQKRIHYLRKKNIYKMFSNRLVVRECNE